MGQPKKSKRTYSRPKKPWDKKRITRDSKLVRDFGLRRKGELWKSESILRNLRARARSFRANPGAKGQEDLIKKVNKIGLSCKTIDDILRLKVEDLLARRLQTIVYKKGLANTHGQARQFIVHRHVWVNGRRVQWPSYLVLIEEENKISISDKVKQTGG